MGGKVNRCGLRLDQECVVGGWRGLLAAAVEQLLQRTSTMLSPTWLRAPTVRVAIMESILQVTDSA